ncbi:HD domain-containing phosphohydrolase [Congregibacter variabilis]|uniref:HD domain-containing phosphohydrolase n=1 Tax=Congregibacter variabilis TaxID=3081200 RepID=A0ABZ0I5K4_9GAMM|nr:HD domain-containing phosphohydrolase [Congregibacter sp. IMCC43200]
MLRVSSRRWLILTDRHNHIGKQSVSGLERINIKELVGENEFDFRQLITNMLDEVHLWKVVRDAAGEILTWRLVDLNPAAQQSWGKKAEDVIGKTTEEIFSTDAKELFAPIVKKIFQDRAAHTWQHYFADLGQHLLMTSYPVGEYFISTGKDISELINAREEAERAREREQLSAASVANTLDQVIKTLSNVLEARDPYTADHDKRVTRVAVMIGEKLELEEFQLRGLGVASALHDIGKIQIPAEILCKPTKLTDAEYQMIREHPTIGADFTRNLDFDWPIADIIEQHHERFDGSGYPNQLSGQSILIEARIIGVADTLQAMATHRPYRSALGIDAAVKEIADGAGTRYDPEVATACLQLIESGELVL